MTNLDATAVPGDDSRSTVQPRNYLRPCLLLLLDEEPTYGYELRHKLEPLSAGHWDPGTVYRALNTMEDEGLVRSTWERSAEGPRRRLYQISEAGSAVLDGLARELCGLRTVVSDFIQRYESHHTAVGRATPRAATAPPPAPSSESLNGRVRVAANGHHRFDAALAPD